MGDRIRLGELLAAIGAIGLAILLGFGAWYSYDSQNLVVPANAETFRPTAEYAISGAVGAAHLGWFALLIVALAAVAGIIFFSRVITLGASPERAVLQAPIAFVASVIAFWVLLVRLVFGRPEVTLDGGQANIVGVDQLPIPTDVALGGWLGLVSVALLAIGTWISMHDDRATSAGAKARTEALLADVPVRSVAHVPGQADPEASVVADDAAPTDDDPSTPTSGGHA